MLGYPEYHHDLIYKYVTLFGMVFSDVEVFRQGADEDELIKVPLNFGPVQKVLAFAEKEHGSDQNAIATLVPRMTFDFVNMVYDPSRKLGKYQTVCRADGTIRAPQPYNIYFQLSILTKTERDATRIVEQILPHFDPTISMTMFPFVGEPSISHDVKISLSSVDRNNDYQGVAEQRQMIVWNLMFELQGWLYGPPKTDGKVIKRIKINYGDLETMEPSETTTISPGVDSMGQATTDPLQAINYSLVDADDDWDFIIEHGTP